MYNFQAAELFLKFIVYLNCIIYTNTVNKISK